MRRSILLALVLSLLGIAGCSTQQNKQAKDVRSAVQQERAGVVAKIEAFKAAIATLPEDDPLREAALKNLPDAESALARIDAYLGLWLALTAPTTQPAK